ncbi:hypothetical protein Mal64_12130 [Pseudobythopirellula maris]|uniref:Uncharacterized protein n=1 Tax=Pseudobythopirellula maris TaxID=2527991 RepID=A0A5C5ZUC9_9BACT|nr:hypothetical protein [Pseudobythopirellula maris]TWT90816.1 hypothetical protein Mal64_12130 [Pseudobythopirellula maris]
MTRPRPIFLIALAALLATAGMVRACPFCVAENRTLSEEIADSSVVLIGSLVVDEDARPDDPTLGGVLNPQDGTARFRVEQVLTGETLLGDEEQIEAIYFGDPQQDVAYLLRGVGEPPEWNIPLPLSDEAVAYVPKLIGLPESGADRMAFFQDYLEHSDSLLAQDAYDEFARAPYSDVQDLAPRMDPEQLMSWIEDPAVSPSRRRLYLTMLGVCGGKEDARRIERLLLSDSRTLKPAARVTVDAAVAAGAPLAAPLAADALLSAERQNKLGLDAMIACYITLSGKAGEGERAMDLIDRRFLADQQGDYSHVYSTLMALRFLAEESDAVPRERVLVSARLLLGSTDFADQVIPDLARWEDWSVLDRLEAMYIDPEAEGVQQYVREPIVAYLDVAAERGGELGERATAALARIEPVDEKAFKRARSLRAFGFLAQARPARDPLENGVRSGEEAVADQLAAQEGPSESSPSVPPLPQASEPTAATPSADETPGPARVVAETVADEPQTIEQTAPLTPPSRFVLLATPLVAGAICLGLFWIILRGGVA